MGSQSPRKPRLGDDAGLSDVETPAASQSPPPTNKPEPTNDRSSRSHPFGLSRVHHQHVAVLLGLLLLVAGLGTIATMNSPVAPFTGSSNESLGLRIDPNSAPWWELTIIPGVGEVTARRIVSFRSENGGTVDRLFRRPADLQGVHGIGPKTAARIAPYLAFPDS